MNTRSWVDDAIKTAQDRGMVPFIAVIPVSPEFLRDAAGPVDLIVGDSASKEIAKAVREWQENDSLGSQEGSQQAE